jgi:cell division protease FtsH
MADSKKIDKNKGKTDKDDKPSGKPKFNAYWIYGAVALAILGFQFIFSGSGNDDISWQRLEREMIKNRDVEKIVVVNKEKAEIYIKPDKLASNRYSDVDSHGFGGIPNNGPHFSYTIPSVEVFSANIKDAQEKYGYSESEIISVRYETRKNIMGDLLGWILPLALLVGVWLFIFRRMGGGAGAGGAGSIFSVGKSKAQLFDKESHVKVDFSDVAGLEEAKMEVRELVDFLKNPKKYTDLGGKIPKGALLIGLPGTGKTLLAKAVAGEANVPFFSISGSDFVEMFVGVGASRVRDLFKQAKEKAPCIVFIDEIDAVGRARGRNTGFGGNDERENTLNQLLTEMDGFGTNSGVIILAATNRADVLDRALLRAGRFDRQIHVDLPDLVERGKIFEVHLKPLKLHKNVEVDFLAKQTPGFSGADIANVCNEAALIAARQNKKKVDKQDFHDAVDRIVGGLERKSKIISLNEKKTIAFHEAGHATVSWLLEYANPLLKVTIIPRGKALGAAWYLPEERQITTTEQLLDEMAAALGGRASEEMIFGKISTGALNDLEKITKQAYAMVSYFGMSDKVGNLSFYDSSGQNEYSFNKPYSEKTAELIDEEVKHLIDESYNKAREVLKKNKKGLTQLAELLLEREVIFSEDVEKIFGKKRGNITKETQDMLMKSDSKSAGKKPSSGVTKKKPPKKEEPGK